MPRTKGERLVADRFRRVWAVAEMIAVEPGLSRAEIADRFFVSERQVQADFGILRDEMGMPIGRRSGYCYLDEGGQSIGGGLNFMDAVLLLESLRRSLRSRSLRQDAVRDLLDRVPQALAPHLRPFGRHHANRIMAGCEPGSWEACVKAISEGGRVSFVLERDSWCTRPRQAHIAPELLIPWRSGWYVIGEGNVNGSDRLLMVPVDEMTDAALIEASAA